MLGLFELTLLIALAAPLLDIKKPVVVVFELVLHLLDRNMRE
jgi:hypothetical protein